MKLTSVLLYMYLGYCGGLSNLVERNYTWYLTGVRLADTTIVLPNTSRTRCCDLCTRQVACYYVSFYAQNSSCELSSGWDALTSFQGSEGWDVYRANLGCPHSISDFVPVGAVAFAICHNSAKQPGAFLECARVPGARLVRPDTVQKFKDLQNFIITRPYYNSSMSISMSTFTDGQFVAGSWRFDTGLPVPMDPALFQDGIIPDGTKPCLWIKMSDGVLWQAGLCEEGRGYICEVDIV